MSAGIVYADDHKQRNATTKAKTRESAPNAAAMPAREQITKNTAHTNTVLPLSLAAGAEGLEIILESPAANIVGFEHAASTDEDKKKLADAKAKLEAGADLFSINPEANVP